jgi:hypothetical protein
MFELLPIKQPLNRSNFVLIIATGEDPKNAERADRAISTKIYARCAGLQIAMDLMTFDPVRESPEWTRLSGPVSSASAHPRVSGQLVSTLLLMASLLTATKCYTASC